MRKWLYFVLAIFACAFSFIGLLFDPVKRYLLDLRFGLDALKDEVWDPIFAGHDMFHSLKNLLVEWVRLNAQRAAKFMAFLAVANFILLVLTVCFIW